MLFGRNIGGYAIHINQPHIRTSPEKPLHLVYTPSNALEDLVSELKAGLQQDDFNRMRALMRAYGLEKAKDESRAHAQNAVVLIELTALNSEIKQFFRDLICYIAADLERY